MDLIDKNALLEEAEKGYWDIDVSELRMILEHVPTVEKRGRWIPDRHWEYQNGNMSMSGDTGMGCSACGAVNFTGINQRTPFCPNCGAKMDGEKGEKE